LSFLHRIFCTNFSSPSYMLYAPPIW
jgi:hypothetical protein